MPPNQKTASSSSLAPARRRSLGEDVADQLREAILHGEFAPGAHMREEDLAARLQVSRGPVRSALALLEREGLVRSSHHRGVIVAELSAADLYEVYTLRSALEPLAVRLAVRRGTDADFAALQQSLATFTTALAARRITEHDAARLDLEFHDQIFAAAHHERLNQAWSQIRLSTYKFLLSRNVANADWREISVGGHQQLYDVISGREEEAAVAVISDHLEAAYRRIYATFGVVEATVGGSEDPWSTNLADWPLR
jgi:DNA-binding GntR family transcriptional regulator